MQTCQLTALDIPPPPCTRLLLILARSMTDNQGPKKWVAYLAAAAHVSSPLLNHLEGLNPPIIDHFWTGEWPTHALSL